MKTKACYDKNNPLFVGDLFHEDVLVEYIDEIMTRIAMCPQHIFIILTKRTNRMFEYFKNTVQYDNWSHLIEDIALREFNELLMVEPPLKNLWVGVSCENQKYADERIPILIETPAQKRIVSLEPLLESVDISDYVNIRSTLDWVIIGAESIGGRPGRECKIEWVESIVQQCKDAGTPVFVKQLHIGGKLEHDINKFPEHLQIRQYPD